MVSSALYDRLPSRPSINSFKNSAPDIIGVGGASAEVRGYIDVPLQIAGIEVADPLLVVSELPFAMLIGMDVLRPHAASFSMCDSTSLQLRNSVCPVCLERRAETKQRSRNAPAVVCTVDANRTPMLPLLPPPVSLSAPTFAAPAVPRFEALSPSVSDLMPVTISETFPASLTVRHSVELLEPPPTLSIIPPSVSPFTLTFEPLSAPSSLLLPASSLEVIPVLALLPSTRSLPPLIHPPLPPPLRPPLIQQSPSRLGPPAAPSRRRPFAPSIVSSQSSAEDLEIGRVENLRLFADDEWLPPSASQIPSLIDLDLTPPPAVSTPLSQTQLTARPKRNVCPPVRFASAESSSVLPSQSLAPAPNSAQPRLPRADLPSHLAPVRKKAQVLVPITSGAIVTSSYGGYSVSNSIRDSPNSEPTLLRAANCCVVALLGPHPQVSRDSRDELIVKKISARYSSNTLVAPPTAKNEIVHSTLCFRFPSF